jgi:GTP-binding protein HflX
MNEEIHTHPNTSGPVGNRAILVGVELKSASGSWTMQDSLVELGRLAETAGLTVAGSASQKLARPNPRTWIGSGKVRELGELVAARDARYVLFDDELSPGQQRNLEAALGDGIQVIDRSRLILDIFSQHAHTREGKLQVELAQYQYLLPRLAGMRAGLSQQTGGTGVGAVGLRGPGETQLELDRRQARKRIAALKGGLEEVRLQRRERRARRESSGPPVVALVGYTNAGKSSLLNALTGADVLVQDKLFATLDPVTRRCALPGGREALFTDTVGFIRKIPYDLIAAFRATLEGIEEASLILHVVDSSHPHPSEQIAAVDDVLASLQLSSTPRLLVWNKIDLLSSEDPPLLISGRHEHSLAVSAKAGNGVPELLAKIETTLREGLREVRLVLPYDRYDLVRLVFEQGSVTAKVDGPNSVVLCALVPLALARMLAPFIAEEA